MQTTLSDRTPDPAIKFDVFISYSHDDGKIAERLSQRIRRFTTPRAIKKQRGRLVVFRDVERLTARPELGDALVEHINEAANLLVLCSPSAVDSTYVDQEIKTFIEIKGTSAVTLVLVDGTPEESFPPSISASFQEPLYIDLRPSSKFFQNRRQFHEGSLRVIAALIGVDFAELNREDERRRSRLRWASVVTILMTSLGLSSFYVADRVPADTWRNIPLPTSYFDSSLLPINDYAVYISDPDIRLFLGYGAEYAAQYPDYPIEIFAGGSEKFVKQADSFLRTEKGAENLSHPVATLNFNLVGRNYPTSIDSDNRSVLGSGELQIYAYLGPTPGSIFFGGVLQYEKIEDESNVSTILYPPSQLNRENPLGLRPWPTNVLNQSGVLPALGSLEGKLQTAWDDTDQSINYEIIDVEDSFWEGNDGQWIEKGVFTDGDDNQQVTIAGGRQDLTDIDDEQWLEIIEDPNWASYEAPQRTHVDEITIYRTADGELRVRGGEVDDGLVSFIEAASDYYYELIYRITRVVSRSTNSTFEIARIISYENENMAERDNIIDSYTLVRKDAISTWQPSKGLGIDQSTDIINAFVIEGEIPSILILTDKEGFFLSRDGGTNWEDFNHGEAALLNASRLRPVVTGKPEGIYVLSINVDGERVEGNNELFRYVRRSWSQQLRVGLIELLQFGK